ncbi:MAG: hypothetical protein R2882_03135 [Gemmatimonadales bacterium]
MDPGVGSSRRVHAHRMAREPLENGFQLCLDGAAISLSLPPDEGGAVELERREKRSRHRAEM